MACDTHKRFIVCGWRCWASARVSAWRADLSQEIEATRSTSTMTCPRADVAFCRLGIRFERSRSRHARTISSPNLPYNNWNLCTDSDLSRPWFSARPRARSVLPNASMNACSPRGSPRPAPHHTTSSAMGYSSLERIPLCPMALRTSMEAAPNPILRPPGPCRRVRSCVRSCVRYYYFVFAVAVAPALTIQQPHVRPVKTCIARSTVGSTSLM